MISPLYYDDIFYNNKKCVCSYCSNMIKKSYIYYFDFSDSYVGYCYSCKKWNNCFLKKYGLLDY